MLGSINNMLKEADAFFGQVAALQMQLNDTKEQEEQIRVLRSQVRTAVLKHSFITFCSYFLRPSLLCVW